LGQSTFLGIEAYINPADTTAIESVSLIEFVNDSSACSGGSLVEASASSKEIKTIVAVGAISGGAVSSYATLIFIILGSICCAASLFGLIYIFISCKKQRELQKGLDKV
jgi:hypothetical protein